MSHATFYYKSFNLTTKMVLIASQFIFVPIYEREIDIYEYMI